MVNWPKPIESHPMFATSMVAVFTAILNLGIIYCMNKTEGLDDGLGMAAIGIVTFCGTLISSSIFEEHRHDHGSTPSKKIIVGKDVPITIKNKLKEINAQAFSDKVDELVKEYKDSDKKLKEKLIEEYKKKSDFIFVSKSNSKKDDAGNFIEGIIVGTGIMRKSLAASLVITYIVLIGLSFSAGDLTDSITTPEELDGGDSSLDSQSILGAASHFIFSGQIIGTAMGDSKTTELTDQITITNSAETKKTLTEPGNGNSKTIEELLLEKKPKTLVEHFTIVITAVIGFYFGSNTLKTLLDAREKDKQNDSDIDEKIKKLSVNQDPLDLLKLRLIKEEITPEQYKKLKTALES